MDDAVGAAYEARIDPRQAVCQPPEKIVVQPSHPSLAATGNLGSVPASAGNHLQLAFHVDDAKAGNEIALELPGKADIVTTGFEVDKQS